MAGGYSGGWFYVVLFELTNPVCWIKLNSDSYPDFSFYIPFNHKYNTLNLYSNENRDSCLRILHCLYQRMQSCRLHLANIKCLARSAVPISSQKSSQSVYGQKVLRVPQPPLRSRYRQVAPRRRHMSLSAALWPTATVTWRGCAARRTLIRSAHVETATGTNGNIAQS